jgi:hypothetical protein
VNDSAPGSLTDIAFETGVIAERNRIIRLLVESANAKGWIEWEASELLAAIIGEDK